MKLTKLHESTTEPLTHILKIQHIFKNRMRIHKDNCSFVIPNDEKFSMAWFNNGNTLSWWEPDTFHILQYYKNFNEGTYIDVGAWIGPTVLYAANIYKKVIAIEPDPVAIERIKKNINANDFKNIVLVEKGLSNENGFTNFGGNGELGNSQSTLLAANKDEYLKEAGSYVKSMTHDDIVKIETITIEKLLHEQNVHPRDIGLIKMDIEGGEKIVVPAISGLLKKYKPPFFISLHRCFLNESEIEKIIDILFGIYNLCFYFTDDGEKVLTDKKFIQKNNLLSLVFE